MRRNKFNARKVFIDNRWFDSQLEGRRYVQLRVMEAGGVITGLECQPEFVLTVINLVTKKKTKVGKYHPDFKYSENGEAVYEDVKGIVTKDAALRIKLTEAMYGVKIRIIKKEDMY